VAIKDLIDVAGVPTTAGSPAVAAVATPATSDAACMAGLREADAAIVGKANLHELAFGGTGVNRWFGTPRNPLDHRRIPGGSSSGSAVAVATGEADIALGTDTAGSIRTPSACCGTVGLKTTHGRILVGGVRALAPSLDVVGPMARDVAGVVAGMRLLDPGFSMDGAAPAPVIGRVRISGVDPRIDQALDDVLRLSEVEVLDLELPGFSRAAAAGVTVLLAEAWTVNRRLHDDHPDRLGPDVLQRLEHGCRITEADLDRARTVSARGDTSWTPRGIGPLCWCGPRYESLLRHWTAPRPTPGRPMCPSTSLGALRWPSRCRAAPASRRASNSSDPMGTRPCYVQPASSSRPPRPPPEREADRRPGGRDRCLRRDGRRQVPVRDQRLDQFNRLRRRVTHDLFLAPV